MNIGILSSGILEIAVALIGALTTALGSAAASGLFEKARQICAQRSEVEGQATLESAVVKSFGGLTAPVKRVDEARKHVFVRINDASVARTRSRVTAAGAKWASNLLISGQYVVGAALTTSFIQKELSPNLIGLFGVIVVVSSAVKQHYRPEVTAQIAFEQVNEFDKLIRQSEDRVVVIDTIADQTADDPTSFLELIERISAEITRITSNSPRQTAQQTRK